MRRTGGAFEVVRVIVIEKKSPRIEVNRVSGRDEAVIGQRKDSWNPSVVHVRMGTLAVHLKNSIIETTEKKRAKTYFICVDISKLWMLHNAPFVDRISNLSRQLHCFLAIDRIKARRFLFALGINTQ
jgi:hypothetical protein